MRVKNTAWLVGGLILLGSAAYASAWSSTKVPESLPASATSQGVDCRDSDAPEIVELELAGSEERAKRVIGRDPCTKAVLVETLRRDPVFILTYVAAIACLCAWGAQGFRSKNLRMLGWVAIGVTVVAAGLDVLENSLLGEVLHGHPVTAPDATAASLAKWGLLLLPVAYAVGALATMFLRVVTKGPADPRKPPDDEEWRATALAPDRLRTIRGVSPVAAFERWWWATRPPTHDAWDRPPPDARGTVGIAFSGGGIRSASFHLGVLEKCLATQWPKENAADTVLRHARYISTVSGGGYVGIARQIALHDASTPPPANPPGADDAFAAGSPEQEWVRDRRKYLWDSMTLRMLGMAKIVLGIVINLALFGFLLYAAARPIGWFAGEYVFDKGTSGANESLFWLIGGALGALAIAAFAVRQLPSVVGDAARAIATCFGFAGATILMVGLATVGWMWMLVAFAAAIAVVSLIGTFVRIGDRGQFKMRAIVWAIPGAILAACALAAARNWVEGGANHGISGDASFGPVPFQLLVIVIALLTFGTVVVYFLIECCPAKPRFGAPIAVVGIAAVIATWCCLASWDPALGPVPEACVWGAVAASLAATFLWVDQRLWSPHVFYKKRLMHTFSPVRTQNGKNDELAKNVATPLDEWAARVPGHPELLVCAAVALPGTRFGERPAGAFTFAHNIVGGPDVGWVRTSELQWWLRGRVRGDSTLRAALAISGAAIASANGYMNLGSVNALLALLNARLGVWLPNPTHVHELQGRIPAAEGDRGVLVRHRNIGYSIKEVFGQYDPGDRFVYTSDGGHHDNLGMIELLRRRCRVILCFDASGDRAGTVRTFEQVRDRAFHELGVTLKRVSKVEAEQDKTNARLQEAARVDELAIGKARIDAFEISYPPLEPPPHADAYSFPEEHGLLVFAKCIELNQTTGHLPKSREPVGKYPRDRTASQWFSGDRLDSYRNLGSEVTVEALKLLAEKLDSLGIDA